MQLERGGACGIDHAIERAAVQNESDIGPVDLRVHQGPQTAHSYRKFDHFPKFALRVPGQGELAYIAKREGEHHNQAQRSDGSTAMPTVSGRTHPWNADVGCHKL